MTRTLVARTTVSGRALVSGRGTGGAAVIVPPSGPHIISGPTAAVSSAQVTVTWSLDQFCQGYFEYGPTTGYGTESPHETSFDYSTHIQVVDGLAAGTYHYKVHSTNAQGQTVASADGTFTIGSVTTYLPRAAAVSLAGHTSGSVVDISAFQPLTWPSFGQWQPTSGVIYNWPIGANEAAQDTFWSTLPAGTITQPTIVYLAPGQTWPRVHCLEWGPAHNYTIWWQYGAKLHSQGTGGYSYDSTGQSYFRIGLTTTSAITHHVKVLGGEMYGDNASCASWSAMTAGATGEDGNSFFFAGQVEDFELADIWMRNQYGNAIGMQGQNTSTTVRAQRGVMHHLLMEHGALIIDHCIDVYLQWFTFRDSTGSPIDAEDCRSTAVRFDGFHVADGVVDGYGWTLYLVAQGAPGWTVHQPSGLIGRPWTQCAFSCSYQPDNIHQPMNDHTFDRVAFLRGSLGWGADPAHYTSQAGDTSAIIYWGHAEGGNYSAKTAVAVRDCDFTAIPANQKAIAIGFTGVNGGTITGNLLGGQSLRLLGCSNVTQTPNTA